MSEYGWGELKTVLENDMIRRVYLWGPPGVGKTRFGQDVLKARFSRVFQTTCNDDTSVQELQGHYVPKGNEFVWHDGPLTQAWRDPGSALVINEIPRASGAVRDLLLSVLDDISVASVALPTGEILKPHASFTVICTGNDKPEECLTEALVDRFDLILHLRRPNPELITKLNKVRPMAGTLVDRSYHSTTGYISPRKMISFLTLMSKKGNLLSEEQVAGLVFGKQASEILSALKVLESK